MKSHVNFYQFSDTFKRSDYKNKFTYQGLIALFDYLEELEDDLGEEIEFDMIALCCEYSEYGSPWEAASNCGFTPEPETEYVECEHCEGHGHIGDDPCPTCEGEGDKEIECELSEDDLNEQALEWLNKQCAVIPVDGGGVIISAF